VLVLAAAVVLEQRKKQQLQCLYVSASYLNAHARLSRRPIHVFRQESLSNTEQWFQAHVQFVNAEYDSIVYSIALDNDSMVPHCQRSASISARAAACYCCCWHRRATACNASNACNQSL
jgi:hypothetical protein